MMKNFLNMKKLIIMVTKYIHFMNFWMDILKKQKVIFSMSFG